MALRNCFVLQYCLVHIYLFIIFNFCFFVMLYLSTIIFIYTLYTVYTLIALFCQYVSSLSPLHRIWVIHVTTTVTVYSCLCYCHYYFCYHCLRLMFLFSFCHDYFLCFFLSCILLLILCFLSSTVKSEVRKRTLVVRGGEVLQIPIGGIIIITSDFIEIGGVIN